MRIIPYLIIIILLCGCKKTSVTADKALTKPLNDQILKSEEQVMTENYGLYYKKKYNLQKYEPTTGCYLGAYILANKEIGFNIDKYENIAGKSHAIYSYNMTLGDDVPGDWILSLISKHKTPLIVVNPKDNDDIYNIGAKLDTLAMGLSYYNVPMFVALYPNPEKLSTAEDEYKNFFKKAKTSFEQFAPNAALVFGFDKDSKSALNYYPGDDYVDWVLLNMYYPLYQDGDFIEYDISNDISYFYKQFNERKPIMLTFAVSHFSSFDHKYYNELAGNRINKTYYDIAENFKRIKAVCYMDFNNISLTDQSVVSDNFKITDDETVLYAYKDRIFEEHFLSEVTDSESEDTIETLKSRHDAIKYGAKLFLPENMLKEDLNIYLSKSKKTLIENEYYYDILDIETEAGIVISVDNDKKIVIVK